MCCTWCTAAYAHKHMIHDPLIQWNQEEINTLVKKKKKHLLIHSLYWMKQFIE